MSPPFEGFYLNFGGVKVYGDPMRTYSDELKARIISRLLPPNNEFIPDVSKETGIPQDTLYAWRIQHRKDPRSTSPNRAGFGKMTGAQKFDIVLETAAMNEAELSAYCRKKGLYPEQINAWRKACRSANTRAASRDEREKNRQLSKEIKQLKAELHRKEKALAEAAALLVLKKKVQAIWGDPEDEK